MALYLVSVMIYWDQHFSECCERLLLEWRVKTTEGEGWLQWAFLMIFFSCHADPKIYREVGTRVQALSLTTVKKVTGISYLLTLFVPFSCGLYLLPGAVCKPQALWLTSLLWMHCAAGVSLWLHSSFIAFSLTHHPFCVCFNRLVRCRF